MGALALLALLGWMGWVSWRTSRAASATGLDGAVGEAALSPSFAAERRRRDRRLGDRRLRAGAAGHDGADSRAPRDARTGAEARGRLRGGGASASASLRDGRRREDGPRRPLRRR
ncbi:MAG TPA: hypothetical protein VF606_10725, partial [Geminicoccaceae bacterium]